MVPIETKRYLMKINGKLILTSTAAKIPTFNGEETLYIGPIIKQEFIDCEWNGDPLYDPFNYFDAEYKEDEAPDVKPECKFKIDLEEPASISSYKDLIRLHCLSCQKTSNVQTWKSSICPKCQGIVKFQCIQCGKYYKHDTSAYRHVRFCKNLHEIVKPTKKYNPYNRKAREVEIKIESKSSATRCSVCNKKCRNLVSKKAHEKLCGVEPNIKCDFCPYKSKYKGDVLKHTQNMHIKPECKLPIANIAKNIKYHVLRHKKSVLHNSNLKKKSKNLISDKSQKMRMHSSETSFANCSIKKEKKEKYHRNSSLNLNLEVACKLCNKKCENIYALRSHLRRACDRRNAQVVLQRTSEI